MFEFSRKGGNEMIINVLESIKTELLKIDYNKLATQLGVIVKGVSKTMPFIMGSLSVIIKLLLAMLAINNFKSLE